MEQKAKVKLFIINIYGRPVWYVFMKPYGYAN